MLESVGGGVERGYIWLIPRIGRSLWLEVRDRGTVFCGISRDCYFGGRCSEHISEAGSKSRCAYVHDQGVFVILVEVQ